MAHVADVPVMRPVGPAQSTRRYSGALPALAVYIIGIAASCGLIYLSVQQAKTSTSHTHFAVFWAGMLLGIGASVFGAFQLPYRRRWPAVLFVYGLVSFLPKFLTSINSPVYYDEYGHLRHAQDMLASGHIEVKNAFLPVVQYFPVLGLLTEGVHEVTRLDLWHSGTLIIVAAHCAALLGIRALARSMDFSEPAAFTSALIFGVNPAFLYFDSQYAYESLAMPMVIGVIVCCVRARRATSAQAGSAYAVAGIALASVLTFTHHVATVVAIVGVVLVAIFIPATPRIRAESTDLAELGAGRHDRRRAHRGSGIRALPYFNGWLVAAWLTAIGAVWILGFATSTRTYLQPSIDSGFHEAWRRLFGGGGGSSGGASPTGAAAPSTNHTPFAGASIPGYERYIAYIVPVALAIAVCYNVWRIFTTAVDRQAEVRAALPFFLFSVFYFLSLPLALTSSGNEAAHRSWPYFYIGLAIFVPWCWGRAGLSVGRLRPPLRLPRLAGLAALTVALLVVLVGNTTAGTAVIYRFPGPFVFGSDARFQTPELHSVADWAAKNLPAGSGVVTDRYTAQELLVTTKVRLPTTKQAFVYGLYKSPQAPDAQLRDFLRKNGFRYFVLDTRIAHELPNKVFFQSYKGYGQSINFTALAGLHDSSFIRLIYSSQNYRIYQLTP